MIIYVVGDFVYAVLSYVVCVLMSCVLYYLKVKCRDELRVMSDVVGIWGV